MAVVTRVAALDIISRMPGTQPNQPYSQSYDSVGNVQAVAVRAAAWSMTACHFRLQPAPTFATYQAAGTLEAVLLNLRLIAHMKGLARQQDCVEKIQFVRRRKVSVVKHQIQSRRVIHPDYRCVRNRRISCNDRQHFPSGDEAPAE